MQAPHLIHFSSSILYTSLTLPIMASAGQILAHLLHPLHRSGMILMVFKASHTLAWHFLSTICWIYSSLKYLRVERTGLPRQSGHCRAARRIIRHGIACRGRELGGLGGAAGTARGRSGADSPASSGCGGDGERFGGRSLAGAFSRAAVVHHARPDSRVLSGRHCAGLRRHREGVAFRCWRRLCAAWRTAA